MLYTSSAKLWLSIFKPLQKNRLPEHIKIVQVAYLAWSLKTPTYLLRNTQFLTRVNFIWIAQHWLVGFKNFHIFIGITIIFFRDGR